MCSIVLHVMKCFFLSNITLQHPSNPNLLVQFCMLMSMGSVDLVHPWQQLYGIFI